jgi:hypothetical protein
MKRIWLPTAVALILAGTCLADTVTVQVKEGRVRKEPRFFSPSIAKVALGDKLEVLSTSGDWLEVSHSGTQGWIHSNSVTTKTVSLSTTKSVGSETTSDEVTLAGKGFSKEVEDQYKKEHPTYDFAAVDDIERRKLSERELEQFRREGRLGEFGGGS